MASIRVYSRRVSLFRIWLAPRRANRRALLYPENVLDDYGSNLLNIASVTKRVRVEYDEVRKLARLDGA